MDKRDRLPPLRVGDIVLIRHRRGVMRHFLRILTDSPWDHCGLVIYPPPPGGTANDAVIFESIQYGLMSKYRQGAAIHRLERYLERPDDFHVGIKRIPWLTPTLQERIRTFLLMNIDTPYFPVSTLLVILGAMFPRYGRWLLSRLRFSCSGVVQKALYEAVDWEDRPRVLFGGSGYTPIEAQDVTSPADIARSPLADWAYRPHGLPRH
jgi:hypothetical protein